MIVLHLSDLHLSRYGETVLWTRRDPDDGRDWTPIHTWQRWQVEGARDKKGRPQDLRLVDPEGVVHKARSWPSRKDDGAISDLLAAAMKRHETSAERLIQSPPPEEDLEPLIRLDPSNTNLLFLRLIKRVEAISPDVIFITGDITDNGFGYALVRHHLAPWIERGRLLVVPGNHDTYDMMPRMGRRRRSEIKEATYQAFAQAIRMTPNKAGLYNRLLADVAVVGINSCMMPRVPLSASGEVSSEQLAWIRDLGKDAAFRSARLRVALVHHHILPMPLRLGGRSPIEVGMRLRNGVETLDALGEAGFDFIFHGHRHCGYVVKLPGKPMVVSSPSSTLGCETYGKPYLWQLDFSRQQPFPELVEVDPKGDSGGGSRRPYF